MTAANTSVNSMYRLGITGNKEFFSECRKSGLKYGVHLSKRGGAQINFRRTGVGVPSVGFTNLNEGLTVEAPEDGIRADSVLHRLWVVLNGKDVIKLSKKGITTTTTHESPFQIDNYDDEDVQKATTEIRLVNYHDTPSSQVSFWTCRGTNTAQTTLVAGDQIGVVRFRGYKGGTPVDEISAEVEVLADTGYGTHSDGRMRIRLRDNAGTLNTILDMNGSGITSIGTINGAITHRSTFAQYNGILYKINFASVPSLFMIRANGTEASPSNLADDDYVGDIVHSGRIGGSYIDLSHIRCGVIESDTGKSKLQLRVCGSDGSVADSVEVYPEGISVPSALAVFWGVPTRDGSWKMARDTDDLVFYRMESSTWVEKSRIET